MPNLREGGHISEEHWTLPKGLRDELKVPLGPIITDDGLPEHVGDRMFAVVGDVAAVHCVKAGFIPKIAIVDLRTKRHKPGEFTEEVRNIGEECIRVVSPPTQITRSLWDAIERAYNYDGTIRIEVEGEEDLAFIPCVLLAPEGSLVLYGMPDKGMVVVTVNDRSRKMVSDAFDKFEHLGGD